MSHIKHCLGFLTIAMITAPAVSFAQLSSGSGTGNELSGFISTLVGFINAVLIPAILALAFLVFVWGVFKYFVAGGADDDAKAKGKSLMLYAIAGFVLILIFFGVVNLLTSSIGLEEPFDNSLIPGGPVPAE